jgi:NADH:ubiquinone oxidoreductase subunit 2 (subunit N)
MRDLVLVPEVLIGVLAVLVLVAGRTGWISGSSRRYLPGVAVAVALVALAFELTAGATLNTYFGGSLVQDRFALFAKLAVLLAVTIGLPTGRPRSRLRSGWRCRYWPPSG